MRRSGLWVAISFFLALNLFAFGKPDEDSVEPSTGYDSQSEVVRGGECRIVLEAVEMPKYETVFEIVPDSGPFHGTLSEPHRLSNGLMAYRYKHNGEKGVEADSFRFKFKTSPQKSWGYRNATITIADRKPSLSLSHKRLDFGEVFIGESQRRKLTVKNSGGGTLALDLKVSDPWSCSEFVKIELGEGESIDLPIIFEPVTVPEQVGRLEFFKERRLVSAVELVGKGKSRFEVPAEAAFPAVIGAAAIDIPVTNFSESEIKIESKAAPPLLNGEPVVIAPSATGRLQLRIPVHHYSDSISRVSVTDGASTQEIKIALPPPSPLLAWYCDQGEQSIQGFAESQIPVSATLRNEGSSAAEIFLESSSPELSLRGSLSFFLDAGASKQIDAVWTLPKQAGSAEATLVAKSGGISQRLEWKARIVTPQVPPPIAPTLVPAPPMLIEKIKSPSLLVGQISPAEFDQKQKRVPRDIRYQCQSGWFSSEVKITWKYRGPEPIQFILERYEKKPRDLFNNPLEKRMKVPSGLPSPQSHFAWQAFEPTVISKGSDGWCRYSLVAWLRRADAHT